ncbi:MAG: ATP-binding cassette domain-containing protein [Pseudomonadales bacterium]|nr:ATP-binding cassette domain-containing protein [Pseudomonadales bacterium]
MNIAIEAKNISKQYHIGRVNTQTLGLQQRALAGLAAPFKRIGGLLSGRATAAADLDQVFWALRDVSFNINEGEVVGIIGGNGAGKSTLLKVLSRITEPSSGTAMIKGRVGSLLEVGTGFHPELTGRENVYLNGSILGMSKNEVQKKFDEIVDFSEVEKFIDTPVKHYSSGMRVRLAFSVAAHVLPDVLIVDEVLSVGDVSFRKKCMDKMHEVGRQGSTVLVVSHNAQAITNMCQRAIWLEKGQINADGPVEKILASYLSQGMGLSGQRIWEASDAPGGTLARLRSISIKRENGEVTDSIDVRERFCIETEVDVLECGNGLVINHWFINSDGVNAFSSVDPENPTWKQQAWLPGRYLLKTWVPGNYLQVDTYTLDNILWAWEPRQQLQCHARDSVCFHVIESMESTSARSGWLGNLPGVVRPRLEWEMVHIGDDSIAKTSA